MSEKASHSPNYLVLNQTLRRCASIFAKRRQRRLGEFERVTKSVAKSMAQSVTTNIADRKLRSQLRASFYNQLAPLLHAVGDDRLAERVRYRKALIVAVVNGTLLTVTLVWVLLINVWSLI